LGQGRDAVKSLIKDNPELADELEVKIKARIKNWLKQKKVGQGQLFYLSMSLFVI
jgi:predicted XRE-type DNA-binding protein